MSILFNQHLYYTHLYYTMKKLSFYACLALVMLLAACSKDDEGPTTITTTNPQDSTINVVEQPKPTISATDPQAVSDALRFTDGTTKMPGTPPAPTNSGLTLYKGDSITQMMNGRKSAISLSIDNNNNTEIAGYYLKVQGFADYYTIPVTKTNGGRQSLQALLSGKMMASLSRNNGGRIDSTGGTPYLPIEVPASIQPGIFCVSYCVYDAQNNISNIVERCIEVVQLGGGQEANFLVQNGWKYEKGEEYINGILDYIFIPYDTNDYNVSYCYNSNNVVIDSIQEWTHYTKINFWFYANAAMKVEGEGTRFDKYGENGYVSGADDCSLASVFDISFNEAGAWSFDNATQTLTLIHDFDEDGDVYVEQWKIESKTSNSMVMKINADNGNGNTYHVLLYLSKL